MICKSVEWASEGSLYCSIKFQGLEIEFAGANAKGGGTIYVHALGPKQTLNPRGRRCIVVQFGAEAENGATMGPHIMFRDDATIAHVYENKEGWESCE